MPHVIAVDKHTTLDQAGDAQILGVVGDWIVPRYPIGSANIWCRPARSIAARRLAEAIAGMAYAVTGADIGGDDALARRLGAAAAAAAARHEAAPPRDLVAVAIAAALDEIGADLAYVTRRLAEIAETRTRARLDEIRRSAAQQLQGVWQLDRDLRRTAERLTAVRNRRERARKPGYILRLDQAEVALVRRHNQILRNLTRAEAAPIPSTALRADKRKRREELRARSRRLHAARRAFRAALRRLAQPAARAGAAA